MCPTSRSCCCMRRTRAYSPAIASRHPVSPHRQATRAAAAIVVCPNSPAAPAARVERAPAMDARNPGR